MKLIVVAEDQGVPNKPQDILYIRAVTDADGDFAIQVAKGPTFAHPVDVMYFTTYEGMLKGYTFNVRGEGLENLVHLTTAGTLSIA